MAEMIPLRMDNENPGLGAERMVFSWFSSDMIKGVVLHSLLQKNQKRKLIAEIDFLYISRRGILCVEVKGGKAISREAGEWLSTSKGGLIHQISNPFNQAQDCSFALKNHLLDIYGRYSEEANITVGFAVVFPECIFTGKGNDLLTEVMFDCSKNIDDFGAFLDKAFDFWDRQLYTKLGKQARQLSDSQVKKLTDLLRGDFSVVPSISIEIQHAERQLHMLTKEQYDALEIVEMNDRVIIMGGAGTGKTLLAIEETRKSLAKNKKVAFLCYNKNLAKVVQQILRAEKNNCYVGTYHDFIGRYLGNEPESGPDVNKLATTFLESKCAAEEFDCLIVDEAQDLMYVNVWESLNKFLKGSMDKGRWTLFLDQNQNMFNTTDDYNAAMECLKAFYSPAMIPLTLNCRNTEQIGRLTTQITKMPPAKHMKASGPAVTIKPYSDQKELLSMLRAEITALINGGCMPKDMVILSKYRLENSDLSGIKPICNLPINYAEDILMFSETALNYFTIQSFKGLEANIVFLVDINGFDELKNRILNYVASTRAKVVLFAYYRFEAHNEYLEVIKD